MKKLALFQLYGFGFYGLFFNFLFISNTAYSQQKKSPITVKGEMGLYGDFYQMNSDTLGAVEPRRPDFLGRVVVGISVNIKDFSMPITMALPTGQYGVILPSVPAVPNLSFSSLSIPDLKLILKNPLNRIGIAPKYKWCELLLGSQIPNYSELSVGDLSMFGAGVNLSPGKFRFSFFEGLSQLAVEADTLNNKPGIYARRIYSAKIGVGHEDSSHIYLIGSKMDDNTSSLNYKPSTLMPQSGILGSLDFRLNFSKILFLKGEIAGSAFTRDVRSNEVPDFSPAPPKSIFNPRESSRLDYASVLSIGGNWKKFGIKTTGRYYGDGFVPMGYLFLQTDRFDVTVDPRFSFFKNKVQLSGSIGKRINNLSGQRAATTTQTLGSANVNVQFTDNLSLSGSYSNFGFRNSITNDTFMVQMVTESWSVSPTYSLKTGSYLHNFTLLYSQNTFKDFNTITGTINDNDAINGSITYFFSSLNSPFTANTLISYFDNNTSYGKLLSKAVNIGFGYKFFKKKLSTNAGLTYAENRLGPLSSGSQIHSILGLKYTLKKKISFALNGSINLFEFGDTRPGISYRENLLRTSITYKL